MHKVGLEAGPRPPSRRHHRSTVAALALAVVLVALSGAPPWGQAAWGQATAGSASSDTTSPTPASTSTSTSTTSSTTSTTVAGGRAGPTTTTTMPPPPEPEDDAPPEPVPTDEVVVPEGDGPAPTDAPVPVLQETAAKAADLHAMFLAQSMAAASAAAEEAARLELEVAALEARLGELQAARSSAVRGYREVRARLRDRAVAAYTGTPASEVNHLLSATDVNELVRRAEMLRTVAEADRARLDDYTAARLEVGVDVERTVSRLEAAQNAAALSRELAGGYADILTTARSRVSGVEAGSGIIAAGFVFPVAGTRWFADTWGAPRMPGTPYEHRHQGTDIFADTGTPLVACERGVVIRMGTDTLGGTKLWLVGASGTRYYYAHLSAFAEGVHDGMAVEAGTVVGYVGNTGNARTTPPHLHFQVHPGGGDPINPYPLLKIVDDAVRIWKEPPG